jgi:pimeloyl-ACP methyl ester carboxylesterase
MVDSTSSLVGPLGAVGHARPAWVPKRGDIQHGYELPCRELLIEGSVVRLFSVPGGTPEQDRTMVCLPGMGASGRSFAPMSPLASQLHFVFWSPPWKTPAHVSPLEHNLKLLASPRAPLPEKFFLLGSSFGSLVALSFALRFPERVRALILASPVASSRRIRRAAMTASTLMRMPLPFAYAFAPTVARVLGGKDLPPEARAEIVRESRRVTPYELGRRLTDILRTDLLPDLKLLQVPTLVIHGGRDLVVPMGSAQDVTERMPKARMELIPKAAHLPYMSHPEEFNRLVHDFLLHVPH